MKICPNCKNELIKNIDSDNSEDWYCEKCNTLFYDSEV